MRRAYCPHCNNVNVIDDKEWGQLAQCEAPGCRRIFMTGGQQSESATPSPPPPAPRPPAPGPPPATSKLLLTGPHICHACHGEIGQALGHRRATIVHRVPARAGQPAGANCRMDIYASIYHCPNPCCSALLETPSHQWGQTIVCRKCAVSFEAPRDDILHEHERDAREGVPFRFRCPACNGGLRCDSIRNGRPMTGQRIVCLHCRQVLEVPAAGATVGGTMRAFPDPREAIQLGANRRCINLACAQKIPARAEVCPLCGQVQGDD